MKQRVSAPAPQPIRGLRNAGHTVRGIRQRRCSRPINNFLCAAQSSSAGVCIRGRQNRLAGGLRGCNHRQSSSIFPCSFPPIIICLGLRHGSQPCLFPYHCLSYNKGSNWLTNPSLGFYVRSKDCQPSSCCSVRFKQVEPTGMPGSSRHAID